MPHTQVRMFEEKDTVGGACKTEYPFSRVPGLGTSTGALSMFKHLAMYLLTSWCFKLQSAYPSAAA